MGKSKSRLSVATPGDYARRPGEQISGNSLASGYVRARSNDPIRLDRMVKMMES
ncbi:MAG TPA: hypothetical protein PLY87_23550 [Planctomycetaceae bacterium]|nr:hypothetical protein [Planctomycetaceae bacterium]HQZ68095.1 hypothetical protein [Planctomycetaceae bacterium]